MSSIEVVNRNQIIKRAAETQEQIKQRFVYMSVFKCVFVLYFLAFVSENVLYAGVF
jgi:hypothetical protein